jgi:hypothetical protein
MKSQKLSDSINAIRHRLVIALYCFLIRRIARKMIDELLDSMLNEKDPGGLKGLDKPARETYGDAIFNPGIPVPPDSHFNV